jgi:hypothetical protein
MRCEFGYCIVCDKEIAPGCGTCGVRKPGPDYTEVQLSMSNKSKMNMACCADCAKDAIWKADKAEMTKALHWKWNKMGHPYDASVMIID